MKAYKTEIKLNKEQKHLFKLNQSACRFVYNLFISENKARHERKEKYLNNFAFSKWLNNEYLPNNHDKIWIKEAYSKAVRNAIDNCHQAYQRAFKNKKGFPKFKKASTDKTGIYFVRQSLSQPIKCVKHKIKIPKLGWVTLKEFSYLPTNENQIINGTITKRANRYFISVITDENFSGMSQLNHNDGVGIDLGIKELAVLSDGTQYANINKTKKVKKLEKRLKRQQRALSRKFEVRKKDKSIQTYKNIEKNKLEVEKCHFRLEQIRNAYINKVIDDIIRKKPRFITIEDLAIKNMMKNKHLSKTIQNQKFYYFKQVLIQKATKHNIEIREVGRFYPSSKMCSCCGKINKNLKLSDRIYKCDCGNILDRDVNAAINLRDSKEYSILNTVGLTEINDYGQCKNLSLVSAEGTNEDTLGEVVTSLRCTIPQKKLLSTN